MKNLLNEIKAMNKIAGTQMTKQQEIKLIKERLEQLKEAAETGPKVIKGTYTISQDSKDTQKYYIQFGNEQVQTHMFAGIVNDKFKWIGSGGCDCGDFFNAIVKDANKGSKFKK